MRAPAPGVVLWGNDVDIVCGGGRTPVLKALISTERGHLTFQGFSGLFFIEQLGHETIALFLNDGQRGLNLVWEIWNVTFDTEDAHRSHFY